MRSSSHAGYTPTAPFGISTSRVSAVTAFTKASSDSPWSTSNCSVFIQVTKYAVGGALAASVAVAVTVWWVRPQPDSLASAANPRVALALHEVRAINVSLDSPEALTGAEIHVVLTGAIGLQGFAEQRDLRWTTDLDRGVNQLTLPLVALGPTGGQVMVEVQHGDKRRTFVVDVQTSDDAARRSVTGGAKPLAV